MADATADLTVKLELYPWVRCHREHIARIPVRGELGMGGCNGATAHIKVHESNMTGMSSGCFGDGVPDGNIN